MIFNILIFFCALMVPTQTFISSKNAIKFLDFIFRYPIESHISAKTLIYFISKQLHTSNH